MNLKTRVRRYLKLKKKDQRWLAEAVGTSGANLSMILAGKRTPSLPLAGRLEEVTGIPARDFDQNEVGVHG